MRVITHHQDGPPERLPPEVRSFIVPIAYDMHAFGLHSHGVSGRCSFCLEPAETMTPGGVERQIGKQRWLAFCQEHDRQRRWVRDRRSRGWWYLPPPNPNELYYWWKLTHTFTGNTKETTGWYLHKVTGETTIDLCARKLHRARALAERYFAVRAPDRSASADTDVER